MLSSTTKCIRSIIVTPLAIEILKSVKMTRYNNDGKQMRMITGNILLPIKHM